MKRISKLHEEELVHILMDNSLVKHGYVQIKANQLEIYGNALDILENAKLQYSINDITFHFVPLPIIL